MTCAETLRQEGFTGKVVLFSKEGVLPYDRTKLSKALNVKTDSILLRPESFFKEHNIDIKLCVEVVSLIPDQKTLKLSDGTVFPYDKAFLAPGGRARRLPVPGHDLKGIHVLREPQDANDINAEFEGKDVVIVGSSFIGLETAAIISKKAKSVHVIGMEKIAFERVLGPQVGATLQNLKNPSTSPQFAYAGKRIDLL
jgi:NADPH-dependent 2,4-dienoyl-CoA reductase/sulfur reductase-like enzyme